jgi:biopolymer transport protein ExbD
MRFVPPPTRERRESVVPMINVVFLLLVFLLVTAEMAPPPPLDVTPPVAPADPSAPAEVEIVVAADGTVAYGDLQGDAALAAVPQGATLAIRADADLPGAALAALLPRLAAAGRIEIVAVQP